MKTTSFLTPAALAIAVFALAACDDVETANTVTEEPAAPAVTEDPTATPTPTE